MAHRGLIAFTAAYMAAAAGMAVARGNLEFLFYIAVMLILIAAVGIVHRRVGLSPGLLWCLSLWGLAHMAGGLVAVPDSWPVNQGSRVLYSLWLIPDLLKYDHLVHAYGFGVTTWLCWQGMRSAAAPARLQPAAGVLVLCGAAAMGFGALNEVVEFAAVLLVPETNVGGYMNTGWDLVANLAGAAIATAIIRVGWARAGRPA